MLLQLLATMGGNASLIDFGRIVDYEREVWNSDTVPKTDTEKKEAEAAADFNGFVIVELFRNSVPVRAVYMVPLGGRSQWFGGLPEKNAAVVLLNTGNFYLILGYVPPPLNMIIHGRKEAERLVDGEFELRASTYENSVNEFWAGARAKFDTYGRLVIRTGDDDFRIIYGPLLSNEYTENVRVVKDVITDETVVCCESYKGAYSRRVDVLGNEIHKTASSIWDISGDELKRVAGRYIVTTAQDLRMESNGQYIEFTDAGVQLKSLKRAFLSSVGNFEISAGGVLRLISMMDLVIMAGGSTVIKTMKELLISTVDKIKISSLKSSATFEALVNVLIEAKTGNVDIEGKVEAKINALKVLLGNATTEPVLKGLVTQQQLLAHMHIGNLGYNTSPASAIPGQFTTDMLSKKVFTE